MGTGEYLDRSFGGCSNIHLTHFISKMVNTNGYWSSHKHKGLSMKRTNTTKVKCAVCGEYISECALSSHLRWSHNLSYKEYFDKFIEPYFHKCPYCDNERKWVGKAGIKYRLTCNSSNCRSKIYSEHNAGGLPNTIKKIQSTKKERYGSIGFNNREKSKSTCEERYGVTNVAKLPEVREKMNETVFKRTGKRYTGGCNGRSKIYYEGLVFDSKHELFYYFWCLEQGLEIQQNPKGLQYFIGETKHTYYPDFMVEGRLIEIKGMDIINKNLILLDKMTKNELWEKTACLFDNDVEIITQDQVEKFYKPSNWKEIMSKAKRNKDLRKDN